MKGTIRGLVRDLSCHILVSISMLWTSTVELFSSLYCNEKETDIFKGVI